MAGKARTLLCRNCGAQIQRAPAQRQATYEHALTRQVSCGPIAQPEMNTRKGQGNFFVLRAALLPVIPLDASRTVSRAELLELHQHLTKLLGLESGTRDHG